MNHDISNWGNPTLFYRKKFYWKYIEKKYWKKVNIDTINWEKLFDRPVDHK